MGRARMGRLRQTTLSQQPRELHQYTPALPVGCAPPGFHQPEPIPTSIQPLFPASDTMVTPPPASKTTDTPPLVSMNSNSDLVPSTGPSKHGPNIATTLDSTEEEMHMMVATLKSMKIKVKVRMCMAALENHHTSIKLAFILSFSTLLQSLTMYNLCSYICSGIVLY